MIGYVKIDKDKIKKWIDEELKKTDYESTWIGQHWTNDFYPHREDFKDAEFVIEFRGSSFFGFRDKSAQFIKLINQCEKENIRLQLFYRDDIASIVGYERYRYVIPTEYVEEFKYLKDYSAFTAGELKLLGNDSLSEGLFPADINDKNKNTLESELDLQKKAIEDKEKEFKLKIEAVRAEALRKEQELKALLEKETEKLRQMEKELQNKITILDTQIYGIRCYLGEVVDFHKIRSGKSMGEDTPMVVYQKVRYLDEELGRYMAIYDFPAMANDSFIDILKHRDDMVELFCPNERCISIVKVSKTGTVKGSHEKIANTLIDIEYLHGRQVGILLRDGENIYLGWTDDEKVILSSDDAFLKPGEVSVKPVQMPDTKHMSSWEISQMEKNEKKFLAKERELRVSRYFIMSVMQGIVDRGGMICFPENVKITEECDYVKFSFAEGWLQDTRFDTFGDILKKIDKVGIKVGETVLTGLTITRDDDYKSRNSAYSNDRGIGYKNRTSDAYVPSFEFITVNKILKTSRVQAKVNIYKACAVQVPGRYFTYDKASVYKIRKDPSDEIIGTATIDIFLSEDDYNRAGGSNPSTLSAVKAYLNKYTYIDIDTSEGLKGTYMDSIRYGDLPDFTTNGIPEVAEIRPYDNTSYEHVYVSVPMNRFTKARVNFEIMSDEFIRADYLCSTWLKYVVTTKQVGNFKLGGSRLNYADSLKYLNKLLEYIKKREVEEKELLKEVGLEKWLENTEEWDVTLTEWKIQNNIPKLTKRAASKFAKTLVI